MVRPAAASTQLTAAVLYWLKMELLQRARVWGGDMYVMLADDISEGGASSPANVFSEHNI